MKHPTLLELNMYADHALDGQKFHHVEAHVAGCSACKAHINSLRQEAAVLVEALRMAEVTVPVFRAPLQLADLLRGTIMLAGLAWILVWVWQTLLPSSIDTILNWLKPAAVSESISASIDAVFFVSEEGSNMLSRLYTLALSSLGLSVAGWLVWNKPFTRTAFSLVLCLFVTTLVSVPSVSAMEIRREDKGDDMTVSAGEVIDDSLIMAGQTIIIEGDVTGDLVIAGQRIIVSGNVGGNLIIFSQTASIEGSVGGSVISFGQSLELEGEVQGSMLNFASMTALRGGNVIRDMWNWSGQFDLDEDSQVGGNTTFFTGIAMVEGSVGRDLTGFTDRLEIRGEVGENVEAYVGSLSLLDDAVINGDLTYRSREDDSLYRSDGAIVGGSVVYENRYHDYVRPNHYATASFYIHQLMRLAAAFLAGLCLFSLAPSLRKISLDGGMAALKAGGVGLLCLVSAPVLMVILAVTIIGIPLSLVTLFAWVLVWYLAKIILAWVVGDTLLANSSRQSMPLKLLAGLVIVIVVVNIPMVGGLLSACMTWIGAGLLVLKIHEGIQARQNGHSGVPA